MSSRDVTRGTVLARVQAGEVCVREAAAMLGLSSRQVKRLYARYQRGGAKALVHGNLGRRSNRAWPGAEQARVVALVRAHYGGTVGRGPGQRFGPTLAAEHLWEEQGVLVPVPTLRRWMQGAGLWSRVRRSRRQHHRRERRAHFGELVQLDGSFHHWLEERGPRGCLMTLIDDATGTTLGAFSAEETIWGAAGVLQAWIAQYGVPRALYLDAKSVYVGPGRVRETLLGARQDTQFGRMCTKQGIELIVAKTPQAKGRVERVHGTNQDRLIKKMRRAGITTYAEANAYLTTHYCAAHNARFAIRAAEPVDFHVAPDPRLQAADVYCLETQRMIGQDWVVRYQNQGLHIVRQGAARRYCAPKTRVLVRETADGALRVVVRPHVGEEHTLRWEPVPVPIAPASRTLPARPSRAAASPSRVARIPTVAQLAQRARWHAQCQTIIDRDCARRQGFTAYNARRQAAAAARRSSPLTEDSLP